nr:tail protein X [Pseudoalteromonas sp. Of7M-16]
MLVTVIRSRDGDTVAIVLFQALGRADDDAEEALYELNPGLEQYGPILPAGVEIHLPVLAESEPKKVVNIWD